MNAIDDPTVEMALIGLTKLIKNVSYYPQGHPTLNQAVAQSHRLFSAVTSRHNQPLILRVSRQGFAIDDRELACKNPLPKTLAARLFAHKIKILTILPELIDRHLLALAQLIGNEPATISTLGGAQAQLDQQHVSTVAVNELNLSAVLKRQHALDQQAGLSGAPGSTAAGAASAGTRHNTQEISLHELLEHLNTLLHHPTPEGEGPFLNSLKRLVQTQQQLLATGQQELNLSVLRQLDVWIHDPQLSARYIGVLKQAVKSLSGKPMIDLLVDLAAEPSQQSMTQRFIELLDDKATSVLLIQRLGEELNPKMRKFISQLLLGMGELALPALVDSLSDERWFMVRNSVAILAEQRSAKLVPCLAPLLDHSDARVAKETIRALARIRSEQASQVLTARLNRKNYPHANHIILALGAQADPASLPTLMAIAGQRDPFLKEKSKTKDALMALGEIGGPQSCKTLLAVLHRFKFFKRREYNEIRCQAITALGRLHDADSLAELERLSKTGSRHLVSAARQALRTRSGGQP